MLSVLQKAIRPMSWSRGIGGLRVVVDPGMRCLPLLGNRDISGLSLRSFAGTAPGRPEAEADDERTREVGLAHSSCEACERSGARRRGASGAKGRDQGECGPANHGPDAEPGSRVTCAGSHTRSRNQEQSTAADHTPASCQRRCLAGGILRTEEERRAWGRRADVDTIRGGFGGKPPKPSRTCAWGRVSSAGLPSTVYSEGGWAASTAGHCRAGGQIVQAAVAAILTPIYETEFLGFSYGFRPERGQHDALDALAYGLGKRWIHWVLDADIRSFLDTASYRPPVHEVRSKSSGSRAMALMRSPFCLPRITWTASSSPRLTRCNTVWRETPSAFIASRMGMKPSPASLLNRAMTSWVNRMRHGGAGGQLLARDDHGVEQAMEGRGGDGERCRRLLDGQQVALSVRGAWLEAGDIPMAAQIADAARLEAVAICRGAPLAIEDAGDHGIGIEGRQPAHERDRILIGAYRGRP